MIALMQLALWLDWWVALTFMTAWTRANLQIRQVRFVLDKNGRRQNVKQIRRDCGILTPAYNTLCTWQSAGIRLIQLASAGTCLLMRVWHMVDISTRVNIHSLYHCNSWTALWSLE
jgi:hypothetical protein